MKSISLEIVEILEHLNVLERAEKVERTVEQKVPAMEFECSERERGETLLTAEHLKITGIHFPDHFSFMISKIAEFVCILIVSIKK